MIGFTNPKNVYLSTNGLRDSLVTVLRPSLSSNFRAHSSRDCCLMLRVCNPKSIVKPSETGRIPNPEGPTYTTIMELGPQNQNRDGFFGA